MAPKKITVLKAEGNKSYRLSDNDEFKVLLQLLGVSGWVNNEGCGIVGFASLVDGGNYTLGRPRPSTLQQVSL